MGIAVALVAGAFGCASTQIATTAQYGGQAPRPARILVFPFATSAAEIDLDDSPTVVAAWKMKGLTASDERNEVGRQVADAVANNLVKKIQEMGLPAERFAGQPWDGRPTIMITGHFVSIDEGSRMERTVIGLGAGRSTVKTAVQVSELLRDDARRLLAQYDVTAQSGRKPGAAETLGAGAAAGTLATAAVVTAGAAVGSEAFGANVDADGRRTADKIADVLQGYFTQQGWIAP